MKSHRCRNLLWMPFEFRRQNHHSMNNIACDFVIWVTIGSSCWFCMHLPCKSLKWVNCWLYSNVQSYYNISMEFPAHSTFRRWFLWDKSDNIWWESSSHVKRSRFSFDSWCAQSDHDGSCMRCTHGIRQYKGTFKQPQANNLEASPAGALSREVQIIWIHILVSQTIEEIFCESSW